MAASPFENAQNYGTATDGQSASIGSGTQINPAYFWKKALMAIVKEQYFGQLADVRAMPKNMGKTIKQHHYLAMLDDENISSQGIDAAGVQMWTSGVNNWALFDRANPNTLIADAVVNAATNEFPDQATAEADANFDANLHIAMPMYGNLYGSSKDVGAIKARMPALTEHGGRVNRVGFTRKTIEATLEKFGFFDEYTQESVDFDTDADLMMHISREALMAANEIVEDRLQIDLLEAAGVIRYPGNATSRATVSGATGEVDEVDYNTLLRTSIDLDQNRCPKQSTIITGSRMQDTRVVNAARMLYCGPDMIPTLENMVDPFGNKALIPVAQYAEAGNVARGEYGSISHFRIIVANEMVRWEGAGAAEGSNAGYQATGGNYDVHPLLCVGSGSFATIGFQTNGKTVKFKIMHKKPGMETADRHDPYGETGFYSIKWYYAFMTLRPEWIARIESVVRQ